MLVFFTYYFDAHTPYTSSGCEKRGAYINWSMPSYLENYLPCAGGFSVVNVMGDVIARPDKLETSQLAHEGSNGNRSGRREGGVESLT